MCVCVRERDREMGREGEGENEFASFLLLTFPSSLGESFLTSRISLILRHVLFFSHFNTLMPGCVIHSKASFIAVGQAMVLL